MQTKLTARAGQGQGKNSDTYNETQGLNFSSFLANLGFLAFKV
jgi:hypothetical protein